MPPKLASASACDREDPGTASVAPSLSRSGSGQKGSSCSVAPEWACDLPRNGEVRELRRGIWLRPRRAETSPNAPDLRSVACNRGDTDPPRLQGQADDIG